MRRRSVAAPYFAASLGFSAVLKSCALRWANAITARSWAPLLVCSCTTCCGEARLENAIQPALATGQAGTSSHSGGVSATFAGTAAGGALSGGSDGDSASAGSSGGVAGEPDGSLAGGGGDDAGGAPPIPHESLISLEDFSASYMVGQVRAEKFAVAGQPFTEAWRGTMTVAPDTHWAGQLVVPVEKAITAGALLHVSFWVRCEKAGDTGDCLTEYVFERASEPWEKSVTFPVHADGAWAQKSEFFSVIESYAAGVAHMVFRLGYAGQTIAIGGIEVESIGTPP